MIFFVTAGNARGMTTVTSVRERSNVVMVNLPANDNGVFRFASQQSDLLIDFGAQGLWTLIDAAAYAANHAANPKNVVAGDLDGNGIDEAIADFGAGIGIWIRWNGATWGQLHCADREHMVTGDLDNNGRLEVILSFPSAGTYVFWNGTTWGKLHDRTRRRCSSPISTAAARTWCSTSRDRASGSSGMRTSWFHLHSQSPTDMAAGDFDGNGIRRPGHRLPGGWRLDLSRTARPGCR